MSTETVELEVVNLDEKLVKYANHTGLEKPAAARKSKANTSLRNIAKIMVVWCSTHS
jgi:hypothetical protein